MWIRLRVGLGIQIRIQRLIQDIGYRIDRDTVRARVGNAGTDTVTDRDRDRVSDTDTDMDRIRDRLSDRYALQDPAEAQAEALTRC